MFNVLSAGRLWQTRGVLKQITSWLCVGLVTACAPTGPEPQDPQPGWLHPNDGPPYSGFKPNPAFKPVAAEFGVIKNALSIEDEIIIIEGDARTVTVGGGGFGITDDNQTAIVQQVLAELPDAFDTIQIYTTFTDLAHDGFAYYQGIKNEVSGIGTGRFNGRAGWGLEPEGRLSGFSNMNSMLMWGNGSFSGLNRVRGYYHGVIAHELSHRWLFRMMFKDGAGNDSDALLGRDSAHWSRLAHAYGSVHDGNFFVDNGDGSFTNRGTDLGFSPLELYAMGRIGPEAVEDFFYLVEATRDNEMLDNLSDIPEGSRIRGRRIDVQIQQVLDAMGPRVPSHRLDDPYYRAAFVLVTAPGEARADWQQHFDTLKEVRRDFPQTWREWTGGGMCTRVTERCPEPVMNTAGARLQDGGDDLLAPGETASLFLRIGNSGIGTAENVQVELRALAGATIAPATMMAPAVEQGGAVELPTPFSVAVSSTVACGTGIEVQARFLTQEGPTFSDTFTLNVGTQTLAFDPLNEAPDWKVNPDGTDSVAGGAWELGEPTQVTALGVDLQPGADRTAGEGRLAFHTGLGTEGGFFRNDLDGRTTLQSPVFALGATRDPLLVFYAWRVARDLSVPALPELDGTDLEVLVSNDGGANWNTLGVVADQTTEWTRYVFRIKDGAVPTDRTLFRFVIEDPTNSGTVEAGLDDLEIVDYLAECPLPGAPDAGVAPPAQMPTDEGCGCTTHGSGGVATFFIVALWALRRRR